MNIIKKIFDHEYKELKKFEVIADQIIELEELMSKLTDKKLKDKTIEFKNRLNNGETLEDIMVEAFAVAREAAFRVIGEKPYYVQLVGGLAIHYGNIAEMKTGEGKTLTSTMPAYLNALPGEGVHIITVNEYLASRDAAWMGEIYRFLGLSVGINYHENTPKEKQEAYASDVMYTTNNELGFDYLRDNMVVKASDRVMRPLNYVIMDEVDSVLIDEARTPLIIAGGQIQTTGLYLDADRFVKTLKENDGYIYDEKSKSVSLDEKGIKLGETHFKLENLYDINNTNLLHYIDQALKANFAMKKDFDYVVQDNAVIIVDQFTGRLMAGRNFSDGLHQAIEAKEGVEIQKETRTLATITFQNFFRLYKKISGMTGTAKTEEEEFREIYNMYVIQIPTNMPIVRKDYGDLIYATKIGKYKAIVNEIKERYETGQPVLVGTIAVETSELISELLRKNKVPHEVLNAKNNTREAEIIAKAGARGSVTIATNMAGRGTDIKIDDEVRKLGGLFVVGTERHESRRIDNQLRGRSGRQGDVGSSQFCVSFEDELMVRFGTDRAKSLLARAGFAEDASIRIGMLSKSIESAQKRVEGNNFDIRKTLLEYDDVINKQREYIYSKRNEILDNDSIHETVLENINNFINILVNSHIMPEGYLTENDFSEILEFTNTNLLKQKISIDEIKNYKVDELIEYLYDKVSKEYNDKLSTVPQEIVNEFEKAISLRVVDNYWMNHITTMDHLKHSIGFRQYAQENPLRAYTNEGFALYEEMLNSIDKEITVLLIKAEIRQNIERKVVEKGQAVIDMNKVKKAAPKKVVKVGRNDLCPCGSGKKYKQCCGK